MQYDLVIRNGDVVDGSGLPRYRADVGVRRGRIATIGRIRERGADEIDAEGHVVTPGFIDGHTHMDAQVLWDPLGTCSCYHGVTSVVMGNCGFTLAPATAGFSLSLIRFHASAILPAQSPRFSWPMRVTYSKFPATKTPKARRELPTFSTTRLISMGQL